VSLFLPLLLAATPAATPPAPEVANEIVVLGRKLETRWKGHLVKTDGQLACKTKRSTGDAAIDAIGCGAMLHCTLAIEPQMDALAADRALSRRDRRRQMGTLVQTTVPCMEDYRDTAIARLAAARAKS
jgi:hypothetical protein